MSSEYTLSKIGLLRRMVKDYIIHNRVVYFKGNYESFEKARGGGYESSDIFERVCEAALKVKSGKAKFERDGVCFYDEEYELQILAALYEIYLNEGALDILDYGGSMGSKYFQNRNRLDQIVGNYSWNVVEQEHFVNFGKQNLEDDKLHFYYSFDKVSSYNCAMFLSSVQYIPDGEKILDQIISEGCKYFILDRVSVSDHERVCMEVVHEPIYEASYPVRVFEEEAFVAKFLNAGYELCFQWMRNPSHAWRVGSKLIKDKSFFFQKK